MLFKYACFISYRHGQKRLVNRIVDDIEESLSSELEAQVSEKVFCDRDRLESGDKYNELLADAIYKSVCMVVLYTPTYFCMDHPYCAREYMGMKTLEKNRLDVLPKSEKNHGLIIPIVFRGPKYLPQEIKGNINCDNFSDFLLSDTNIWKHPEYAGKIRKIADYITARIMAFKELPKNTIPVQEDFKLPSEDEIKDWLKTVQPHKQRSPV